MDPQFPAYDAERDLLILNAGGMLASQPCGNCPEWSIYGVCWRSGGCGVTPCSEDVQLGKQDSTALNDSGCGITKFIYTATKLGDLLWGPVAAPLTGSVSVEFTIDGVSVSGPTSQAVVESIEYSDSYAWPDPTYFASGWHTCKAFVTWTGTKEGVGATTIREMYAACVYAAIRPSGEDELQKHDVLILPGSGNEVCISPTLGAAKMLGPYRHFDDAQFVRQTWSTIIDAYAEHCFCANPCHGETGGGVSANISDETEPMEGTESSYDVTDLVAAVGHGGQYWLDCGPSDYPLYVDLWLEEIDHSRYGFDQELEVTGIYFRFYEDGEEVDEIDVTDGYDGTLVIPACQFVRVVVSLNHRPAAENSGMSVIINATAKFSAYGDYRDPQDCPYLDENEEVQNIEDLVPHNEEALLAWLQENET